MRGRNIHTCIDKVIIFYKHVVYITVCVFV